MNFNLVHHFKIERTARSVVFTGRQIDGREKHYFLITDHFPYFGVPWRERDTHKGHYSIVSVRSDNDIYGNKLARITVKRADDVATLRDDYTKTYEAAVLFHNRVKIDLKIK